VVRRAIGTVPPNRQGVTGRADHEHLFKLRKIKERLFTATGRDIAVERDRYLEEFFERLIDEWRGKK
jgi:hypothetical protein